MRAFVIFRGKLLPLVTRKVFQQSRTSEDELVVLRHSNFFTKNVEAQPGVEPGFLAYETSMLPLHQRALEFIGWRHTNPEACLRSIQYSLNHRF